MALPATDTFTRSGTPSVTIETYSSNWSLVQGVIDVLASTDDFESDDAGDSSARWTADSFDDDQYSEIVVNAIGASRYIGVSVRNSASAATFYGYEADNGTDGKYLFKYVSGSYTGIANSPGSSFSATDTVRLEVSGTTLTPKLNGSTDGDLGAQTDSSISSGSAGVAGAGTASNVSRGDNWEGGNLGGGGPAATSFMTPNRGFW